MRTMTALCGALLLLVLAAPAATAREPRPTGRTIGAAAGTGAMPAVAQAWSDAPGYTVYRPARLPRRPLPVVLWGNGGCFDNGLMASHFLREVASHGYIIVANGAPREERPVVAAVPFVTVPAPAALPVQRTAPDQTQVSQLLAAIDWLGRSALRRNADTRRVAVMGHSCGGLQALAAGADPRIRTVVAFNSGIYVRPGLGLSGVGIVKDDLRKLHTPVAYILGGPADIAYPNGSDDVARLDHVPVFYGNYPVGHGGTFWLANGGEYARVAVAWLDWQLKASQAAGATFAGADCGLCRAKDWTIVRKQFPERP